MVPVKPHPLLLQLLELRCEVDVCTAAQRCVVVAEIVDKD
jgi:hypothetical protein